MMTAAGTDHPSRLKDAEWLTWTSTQAVFSALAAEGHCARAVGGAVRNTLLGRAVGEVDLATDADPQTVTRLAGAAGLKAVPTGLAHGTVTVVADGHPFEVTTLRTDLETYGRHAKVGFTEDWVADARRRDFTINALYADADGGLFDPLGGLEDIVAHRVRFIGDPATRIREDYLRILRFFRFTAELEAPEIDSEGLSACVREHEGLFGLSRERVAAEFRRLLVAPAAMKALDAMFDHGLLVCVLGAVSRLPRLARLIALEQALDREPDAMLRLAALAVEIPEDAERLHERFRLSNKDHAELAAAAAYRESGRDMPEQDAKALIYRARADGFRSRVMLAWANSGDRARDENWQGLYGLPDRWKAPDYPLRGADIAALGIEQGPRVGALLRTIEKRWIAGGFAEDRATLLEAAKREVSALGADAGQEDI